MTLAGCVAKGLGKQDQGDEPARAALTPAPQLVVLLIVDQLQSPYFDRFGSRFTGGLGRIRREAVFFPNGQQAHAVTETAPGHAALASGRYPTHTNIVTNNLGVPDTAAPLIGSYRAGASPARFVGTTFYDWMRAADPQSIVVSVSRKDRGAILPVGRDTADVVWFGGEGGFTRSRWYGDTLPDWVTEWNRGFDLARFAGREWSPAFPDSMYREADDQPWEDGGRDKLFPHHLATSMDDLPTDLHDVPWMDSLTLDVALAGARARRLGERGHTDYLAVSLSTTDAVGHRYGPDSRELEDQLLRLDRWLGAFLDSLAARVPPERTLLVLASDHGMSSYPDRARTDGGNGGTLAFRPIVDSVKSSWRSGFGTDFELVFEAGLLTADAPAMAARGIAMDTVVSGLARRFQVPGVARVYGPKELATAPAGDGEGELWRRTVPADHHWLLAMVLDPGWVFAENSARAQHGSTSAADRRIPIAFVVPGAAARTVDRPIESVDVAPTIAALLGLTPAQPLDGRVVDEVLARVPPRR